MSTTIDERVVEMRFDNKQFESNVSTTMSTLDKLKQSLNLSGASKGLDEVGRAARNCDVSVLGAAAEKVGLKFSAMYSIADQALRNITNSAMIAGKRIVSALTIDPIKTGFSEYETQINAVQTILANTESKGTTLNDVNSALDELNAYADKTIYNFTEMTRNIGTFTAAGTDLDTSVKAIQGIANLAAVSGSNSQQASTAMYQLSQAMASGTVKLMDWNSVVNAGMGGQVFQDALKATAKVHGVAIDDIIKKQGSFRESLSTGWLTTEILTDTLEKFTMYAEEGSEEWEAYKSTLMKKGYTEDQAKEILKMGKTATEAATKVKTVTQLFDTLKEAAQSGWTQTWEILVGDFEEAKELLTSVSDVVGEFINSMSESRNELLENWKVMGGRQDLIDSFKNIFEGLVSVVTPIRDAFREIFPPATAEQLFKITESFKEFTSKLKLSDEGAENLKRTFKGLFAVIDIIKDIFGSAFKAVTSLFGAFGDLGGGILGATASFGDWLVSVRDFIKTTGIFDKVFQGIADVIRAALTGVTGFVKFIKTKFLAPGFETFGKVLDKIQSGMDSVGEAAGGMKGFVISAFEKIGAALESCSLVKLLTGIWEITKSIGSGLFKVLSGLTSGLANAFSGGNFEGILNIVNGLVSGGLLVSIVKFVHDFIEPLNDLAESFTDIFEDVGDTIKVFQAQIKAKTLMNIAIAIGVLAAALFTLSFINEDRLFTAITAISTLFAELILATSLLTKMDGKGKMTMIGTVLIQLSSALLILSLAMKIMSTLSWEEMGVGLLGVAGGLTALVVAVNFLPEAKVKSAATAIKKMSTALLILSLALKIMGTISWEEMGVALTGTVVGLAALVAAANLLPKNMALKSAGILSLSAALVIMAAALKIMATMSWEEIGRGLTVLAGSLVVLVIALNLMKRAVPGATAMLIVAPALVILAGALKIMSSLSMEDIGRGLLAIGGSLAILAIGLNLMRKAVPGATALVVAAAALAILTPTLVILGAMSWDSIVRGLVAIAGAFTVVGIAGKLLAPLIGPIMSLAGAMALIGVGVLAAGVGLMAFGAGLSAIAVGFTAVFASLGAIVPGIIGIIRAVLTGIAEGIVAFCEVIKEGAPVLGDALKAIVITGCDVLVECVPELVSAALQLITGLLDSLAKHTPQLVGSLFNLVIGLLRGLSVHIPEFIQALADIFVSVLRGAIQAFAGMGEGPLLEGLLSVGLLTGIVAALGAIVPLIPSAMAGAIGVGAVIAELSIVLAAIGALAQIPGLEWLINEGGEFLETLGTAIGKFVGGLVGGVAQGFTSSLPQIGTDLSTFMTNLQPFIDGAKSFDESVVNGVKSLVNVILSLSAANIVEGLTSWFTGGSSITSFADELPLLGQGLKGFSDSVAGISPENIISAANAAKALADMTNHIPNEGGIKSWFVGDNSISKFAGDLPFLGLGLKGFSDAVAGVVPENVVAAANAAKALADMTALIPNEGGIKAWFAGESSVSKFAADIVSLGKGLKGFSVEVEGVVPENVIAASNAAKSLAEMTSYIPEEGGIIAWLSGETSISKFASELPTLGKGLKGFSDETAGIVPETVTAASNAAKSLAEMTKNIPEEGGVKAWFVGESSVSKFADDLVRLGKGLKGFSDETTGINPETVVAAANAAKSLAEMTSHIPEEGGVVAWFTGESSLANFADKLPTLGKGLKGFSDSTVDINPETMTAAANAAQALAEMTKHIPNEGGIKAWFTGETNVANFADKLPTLGKGLKGFSDSVAGINPENVTAAANAAKSLAQMTETVPEKTDKIITFGDNLITFGSKLASYFEKTKGITADSTSGSKAAIDAVKQAADVDSSKLTSVATAIDKAGTALKGLSKIPADCASSFTSALKELGENSSSEFVKTFDSLDEDLKKQATAAMDSFVEGIESKKSAATKACEAIAAACKDAISGKYDSFKTAGQNLAQGLADGISANSYKAAAKAKAMAEAAAEAARKALDINSPSKVFRALGYSIPEGLADGIDKLSGVVEDSSVSMTDVSLETVKDSIIRIMDFISEGFDSEPTIRPVLDLSDIRSGARAIGGLFGSPSVGLAANIRAINSTMNKHGQNGSDDKVVSELIKLRKDLADGDRAIYNINGVTVNGDAEVEEAFKTILRAAQRERRM